MSQEYKDYFMRILKTFIQGCLGYIIVALGSGIELNSKEAIKSFVTGVVAAGLSALMNASKIRITEKENDDEL